MTKIKYFSVASLIIAFCLGNAFSQTSKQTGLNNSYQESDLLELIKKAEAKLEGKTFRYTSLTQSFENGQDIPTEYNKYVNEKLLPDRSRTIIEKKTKDGLKRTEYIYIGREYFVRENDGEWKIYKPSGMGSGSGSGSGDRKIEFTEEKSFAAGEMLNGQKVDRYQEILRYTYTYPDRVEKVTRTSAFWFSTEGLFVKKLQESRNETNKTINRETEQYEYDVNLKIEKPAIKITKFSKAVLKERLGKMPVEFIETGENKLNPLFLEIKMIRDGEVKKFVLNGETFFTFNTLRTKLREIAKERTTAQIFLEGTSQVDMRITLAGKESDLRYYNLSQISVEDFEDLIKSLKQVGYYQISVDLRK